LIKTSTLVVVADGGTARFFTWPKLGAYLSEQKDLRMEVPPSEGERGPSPRAQESVGRHRHRIERRLSAHEANEVKFLARVAERIDALADRYSAKSLILCAPPRALGILREALGGGGKAYVLSTIAKDLTKETPEQLDRRMAGLRLPGRTRT
jgi:protein required for attachment to host cells